jgi:hypothetical protein
VKRILALLLFLFAVPARADEIAPEMIAAELRMKAGAELRALQATMTDAERKRLVGLYVAFDPSMSDALAQAACDDDGDYVIVVSDAMLRLVDDVAHAASDDEANGSHRLEDHAAFLAASQVAGKRLLPPPPGFYAPIVGASQEDRLREAIDFVLAHELERLRAGDLVCAHPTATKEHGDDEWTDAERRAANEAAVALYPRHASERDRAAAARVAVARGAVDGALALTRFFDAASRFSPSYARLHPAAGRRAIVEHCRLLTPDPPVDCRL